MQYNVGAILVAVLLLHCNTTSALVWLPVSCTRCQVRIPSIQHMICTAVQRSTRRYRYNCSSRVHQVCTSYNTACLLMLLEDANMQFYRSVRKRTQVYTRQSVRIIALLSRNYYTLSTQARKYLFSTICWFLDLLYNIYAGLARSWAKQPGLQVLTMSCCRHWVKIHVRKFKI